MRARYSPTARFTASRFFLAEGVSEDGFYEITEEEYAERIVEKEEV